MWTRDHSARTGFNMPPIRIRSLSEAAIKDLSVSLPDGEGYPAQDHYYGNGVKF